MATYDQLIAHYFEKVDAGEPIDPAEIIAENPEHSRQLRRFFANLGVLNEFLDKLSQDPPQDVDGAILGDFRVVRELGRGGMGVVYEAEQVSVGRRVALKVLHASAAADSQLARFRNEIQVIASLSHDHIVSVFAVGEQEGNQFFAMQLIEGASLAEVLHEAKAKSLLPLDGMGRNGRSSDRSSSTTARATRSLQDADTADETSSESNASKLFADTQRKERFRRVVTLVETVARTLDYAHAKGIIHRDIKPSNLMLDQEGKVWITDFGLAHLEHEATITISGEILGTVQYMSPEQAMGHRHLVDCRSDIYSLGVVMYLLLTGELPFRGQRRMVLHQILHDEPTAVRQLNSLVPTDLETICLKCLQKEPHRRYQTANALANDLQRYLRGEPIVARPAGPMERAMKWCRRKPMTATVIGTVTLAMALIVGLSLRHAYVVSALNISLANTVIEKENAIDAARSRAEKLRLANYGRGMNLAYDAWRKKWTGEVDRLLAEQIPGEGDTDHRGFEWYLLQKLNWRAPPIELRGHEGSVNDMAVFADGTRLVSVGNDATIRIWNLETNQQECVLRDDRPTRVLSDSTVEFVQQIAATLDATNWIPVSTAGRSYRCVAVSPDASKLVTGNLVLSLWDLEKRCIERDLMVFPTRIYGTAFSPDGKQVAAQGTDDAVQVIQLDDGKLRRFPTNHGSFRLMFTADGRTLMAPFKQDVRRGIRVWDTESWEAIRDIELPVRAFTANGELIAAADDSRKLHVLRCQTGKAHATTPMQQATINDVAISPDNQSLVCCLDDGTLVYAPCGKDLNKEITGTEIEQVTRSIPAHEGAANAARFLDDSRVATCGNDGVIRIWTLLDLPASDEFPAPGCTGVFRFLPGRDNIILLGTTRGFMTYDISSRNVVRDVALWIPESAWATRVLAVSGKGKFVACGNDDGWLVVWDMVLNREVYRLLQTSGRGIADIAFSPDGTLLANSSTDHTVRVRSTDTGAEIARFDTKGHGTAIAFSPDGKYLAYADSEAVLVVRELDTWSEVARRTVTTKIYPQAIVFYPDGSRLVSGHSNGKIWIWDSQTLEDVGQLTGHTDACLHLAIHPDGTTLASHANDIRLWHLPTLTDLGVFTGGWHCDFSSKGILATGSGDRNTKSARLHVWSPYARHPPGAESHADLADASRVATASGDIRLDQSDP